MEHPRTHLARCASSQVHIGTVPTLPGITLFDALQRAATQNIFLIAFAQTTKRVGAKRVGKQRLSPQLPALLKHAFGWTHCAKWLPSLAW